MKKNAYFLSWEIDKKDWKALSTLDRLRAQILFKVILPNSELVIKEPAKSKQKKTNSNEKNA